MKIYKIKIETDDDNIYQLIPDVNSVGAKRFVIKADDTMLKKFLMRCKVCDNTKEPRSYRAITYKEMIRMIQNHCGEVFVYSHMYPKSQEELDCIIRR
jgi:hypothetical protein